MSVVTMQRQTPPAQIRDRRRENRFIVCGNLGHELGDGVAASNQPYFEHKRARRDVQDADWTSFSGYCMDRSGEPSRIRLHIRSSFLERLSLGLRTASVGWVESSRPTIRVNHGGPRRLDPPYVRNASVNRSRRLRVPRGSVLRTRAQQPSRSSRVRSTEPRGTRDKIRESGIAFRPVPKHLRFRFASDLADLVVDDSSDNRTKQTPYI